MNGMQIVKAIKWKWHRFRFYGLIDPRHWNPLVLIGKNLEGFNYLSESLIGIFVDNNLIKIFFISSLDTSTLF